MVRGMCETAAGIVHGYGDEGRYDSAVQVGGALTEEPMAASPTLCAMRVGG